MTGVTRRVLTSLLLLALLLTACGRASPRVTADDGRGVERPSGGIWVPETRDVDPGPQTRAAESDEEDEAPAPRPDEETDASADAADADAGDRAEATNDPQPRPRRQTVSRPADGPSSSESDRAGVDARPTDPPTDADEDVEDDGDEEPAEPEVTGDCGSSSGPPPSRDRLEASVERLQDEIAERWPETQAGAWITEEPTEVRVAFTERVRAALDRLCGTYEYPHLLRGVRAELSAAELDDLHEVAVEERDALREGRPPEDLPEVIRRTRGRYDVVVDHARNGLAVSVERDREGLLAAFRQRYTPRLWLEEGWEPPGEDGDPQETEGGQPQESGAPRDEG